MVWQMLNFHSKCQFIVPFQDLSQIMRLFCTWENICIHTYYPQLTLLSVPVSTQLFPSQIHNLCSELFQAWWTRMQKILCVKFFTLWKHDVKYTHAKPTSGWVKITKTSTVHSILKFYFRCSKDIPHFDNDVSLSSGDFFNFVHSSVSCKTLRFDCST